jgi:DNA-binding beta-propeller fold protein YncE
MQRRSILAAALALLALTAAAPHRFAHKHGTFKLTVPSGPFISGSRVSVDATGITAPFSIALLGPGSVENHDFLAPQVDAATTATLIGASRDAIAYSTVRIVPAPSPRRALIAVATYDDGIAIHDPATFALLGYTPIGGAPGDVTFAPGGTLLAPATDGDTLTRIARRPWKLTQTQSVPLGNEVAVDTRTGDVFVTNRDAGGYGALTRIAGGTVTRVRTGDTAEGIALDPNRGLAYVGNVNDNTVAEVDTRTMRVIRKYASVPRTFGIALDDKARRLFVVSNMSPSMPGNGGHVAAIDLRSGRTVAQTKRLPFPLGVAFDAQRKRVYVTDEAADRAYVFDARTLHTVHAPLDTCHTPWRPRIAGDRLYIPCARSNQVDVFNLRTLHRVPHAPFSTGGFPLSVALWP